MRPGGQPKINRRRAVQLVDAGLNYREAGIALAREEGRPVPYLSTSVARAISPPKQKP